MTLVTLASAARRLTVLAVVLVLLSAGCVSIDPVQTATPARPATPASSPASSAVDRPSEPPPSDSGQASSGPSALPSGQSTPSGSSGPATPGATVHPALAAEIDGVIAQVPAIRQLSADAIVPYEFISREQFEHDLIELAFEEVPEETRAAEERLLKRLDLLPDDADLDQLLIDLYGGQVAAFYRPDNGRFYIIQRDQPFGPADKIIVAHEYTHALQDQHFDLEGTRITDPAEGDAALGQLAVIEGDATKTMQLWAEQNLSPDEMFQVLLESLGQLDDPTLANLPPVLRRQLEFPYSEGFSFVNELYANGGYEAINGAIQDPPSSTEQILHFDKYLANEAPVDVTLPDLSVTLGEGWQGVYRQTLGELLMQVWAAGGELPPETIPGLPGDWPHAEAVAGWGGDRLAMYEHDDGRWVVSWITTWDSDPDADEFFARAHELAPSLDGVAAIVSKEQLGETKVGVLVASDQDSLSSIQSAFDLFQPVMP